MRPLGALALSVSLLAGCGGSGTEEVVRAWSGAVNAGDNYGAAELFAVWRQLDGAAGTT